jgi:hypothetical protein
VKEWDVILTSGSHKKSVWQQTKREREREREGEGGRERERERGREGGRAWSHRFVSV